MKQIFKATPHARILPYRGFQICIQRGKSQRFNFSIYKNLQWINTGVAFNSIDDAEKIAKSKINKLLEGAQA